MQLSDIAGGDFLDIAVEECLSFRHTHTLDPLRNPFVPDQAMAAHRDTIARTKLQQTIRTFESLRSGLRHDGAHFHRNICCNNSCLRGVELTIGSVLVDNWSRSRTEDKSILRRNRAKPLLWRGNRHFSAGSDTGARKNRERISARQHLHSRPPSSE